MLTTWENNDFFDSTSHLLGEWGRVVILQVQVVNGQATITRFTIHIYVITRFTSLQYKCAGEIHLNWLITNAWVVPNMNSNFPSFHLIPGPGIALIGSKGILIILWKGKGFIYHNEVYNTTFPSKEFRIKFVFIIGSKREALLHSTYSFII